MDKNSSFFRYLHEVGAIFVLALTVVAVSFVRFDRNDISLVDGLAGRSTNIALPMSDASCYILSVEYFRGNAQKENLVLPFAYRVLGPFIAAMLPISNPLTALNVLNVVSLVLGGGFLYLLLRKLRYSATSSFIGGMMYAVSFPVFYYGAIGLTDPLTIPIISLFTVLLYTKRWWALAPVLVLGALARETTIVLLPVTAVYVWIVKPKYKWIIVLGASVVFLSTVVAVRSMYADLGNTVWNQPSVDKLMENLRGRAMIANILTFGIPGILTMVWLLRRDVRDKARATVVALPALTGVFFTLCIAAYAFVGGYADGRFLWGISVFAMPFAVDVINRLVLSRFNLNLADKRTA